jgi:hypothetical protein
MTWAAFYRQLRGVHYLPLCLPLMLGLKSYGGPACLPSLCESLRRTATSLYMNVRDRHSWPSSNFHGRKNLSNMVLSTICGHCEFSLEKTFPPNPYVQSCQNCSAKTFKSERIEYPWIYHAVWIWGAYKMLVTIHTTTWIRWSTDHNQRVADPLKCIVVSLAQTLLLKDRIRRPDERWMRELKFSTRTPPMS